MRLFKADISFSIKHTDGTNIRVRFSVVHNLSETRGLDISAAVENWVERTREFTAKSLCNYIKSKDPEFVCMTMNQYKKSLEQ